jgi:hypothetical protein
MKRSAIAPVVLLILLLAEASFAGAPLNGAYQSTDLGGLVSVGRYSEGWGGGGGGALKAGTTLNAASWDGLALASQWHYWCATEAWNAYLLINTVNSNGNGNRTYMKTFSGGKIWLSGSGPWANGDPDYPGTITSYAEFETITYQNWIPIAAITNVQALASFDAYPVDCMTFYIGNGTRVSTTEIGQPAPANYPGFLDPSCNPTYTLGACWDFTSVTLSITDCAVGTERTTWGGIKSMFNE